MSASTGFALIGGLPTKDPDFAVSIVFTIAYVLLLPLAVWRIAIRRTRIGVLIRPGIVLALRIASYIIRAVITAGKPSTGLLIAEQVLLFIGLIPLCEPLISLTRYHIRRDWFPAPVHSEQDEKKTKVDRALRLLRLVLLAAFILGATVGGQAGSAYDDPSAAAALQPQRYATYGLTLAVIVGGPFLATVVTAKEPLPRRPLLFLYACAFCLAIPTVYKIDLAVHPVSPVSRGGKAAFYLLNSLPEWICTTLYFAFDLDAMFDVNNGVWKHKVEKRMKDDKWEGPYMSKDVYLAQTAGGCREEGVSEGLPAYGARMAGAASADSKV